MNGLPFLLAENVEYHILEYNNLSLIVHNRMGGSEGEPQLQENKGNPKKNLEVPRGGISVQLLVHSAIGSLKRFGRQN